LIVNNRLSIIINANYVISEPVVAEAELVPTSADDKEETLKSADETVKDSSGEAVKEEKPIDDTKSMVIDAADQVITKENTTTAINQEEEKKEVEEEKKEILLVEQGVATTPSVNVVASDTSKEPIVESSGIDHMSSL
jgi:hypothetical protein